MIIASIASPYSKPLRGDMMKIKILKQNKKYKNLFNDFNGIEMYYIMPPLRG